MSSRQYSDSLRVGILLALTGGFLDAYTYISRGNVFANAQTGNMVMLGINFMEGNFRGIINYIIPIIAFAIGVLLAEVIRTKLSKRTIEFIEVGKQDNPTLKTIKALAKELGISIEELVK